MLNRLLHSALGPVAPSAVALFAIPAVALALATGPTPTSTQEASLQPVLLDSAFLAGYRWRNIGPDRGGRSIAVSGVKGRPLEAYFGAAGGGLWRGRRSGFLSTQRQKGKANCNIAQ